MSYDPNSVASRTAAWSKHKALSKHARHVLAKSKVALILSQPPAPTAPTAAARKAAAAARDALERHAIGRVGWERTLMPAGRHDGKGGERVAMISNDRKRALLLTADHTGVLRDACGHAFGSALQAAFFCMRMK